MRRGKIVFLILLILGAGVVISYLSWLLKIKADGGILPFIEIFIMLGGIAVIACSAVLRKEHIRFAALEMIIGIIIAVLSAALRWNLLPASRGNGLGGDAENILLGSGLAISILAAIQLTLKPGGGVKAMTENKGIEVNFSAKRLARRPVGTRFYTREWQ